MAERRRLRVVPQGARGTRVGSCSQRLIANIARYPDRLTQLERMELEQHGFGCDPCAHELRNMGGDFAGLERSQRRSQTHERIYDRVSARITADQGRC